MMKSNILLWFSLLLLIPSTSCRTPERYKKSADDSALEIVKEKRRQAFGEAADFTLEQAETALREKLLLNQGLPHKVPVNAPETDTELNEPLIIGLHDALKIAAANTRSYRSEKEKLYRSALALDLARDEYRTSFAGYLSGLWQSNQGSDPIESGARGTADFSVSQKLKSGAELTAGLAFDLAKLLTGGRETSKGIAADLSITMPLLRGAGRDIAAEPLTQAEKNVLYAVWDFERFKKTFVVSVADQYLSALQQSQQVINVQENYKRLRDGRDRAKRLAEAGRLPEIQYDQAVQDELRARNRLVLAIQSNESRLDRLKTALGLPPDANVELETSELEQLRELGTNLVPANNPSKVETEFVVPELNEERPLEMRWERAVIIAFENRSDLFAAFGKLEDAKRKLAVAEDALRAGLSLTASGSTGSRRSVGSADSEDASLAVNDGFYQAEMKLNLPMERTAERNAYRESLISLDRTKRSLEEKEDTIKLEVRERLRSLLDARETLRIQLESVRLAEKRVNSTDLFLQAGRAQVRDVLEAQEALLSARNGVISAVVDYRMAELELQRDLGILKVDENGRWTEYTKETE